MRSERHADEPRRVRSDLYAWCVAADEVVLRRVARVRALRFLDKGSPVGLDGGQCLRPAEVSEREDRVVALLEVVEHAPLDVVERRRLLLVAAARRPVSEQPVVDLVRRDDPAELGLLRGAHESIAAP